MLYPLSYSRAAFECIKSVRGGRALIEGPHLPMTTGMHTFEASAHTLYRGARPILYGCARAFIGATHARVFTGFEA